MTDIQNPSALTIDPQTGDLLITTDPIQGDGEVVRVPGFGTPTDLLMLTPSIANAQIESSHTVTATLSDLLGTVKPNIPITFTVVLGPNAGIDGLCAPDPDCTTDSSGRVSFTYDRPRRGWGRHHPRLLR